LREGVRMAQVRVTPGHALDSSGTVASATPHAQRLWRLVAVGLCVPGLVALFLPMVWSVSPIRAVTPNRHMPLVAWLLAVPFFVIVPMVLWRLRAFWRRPLGRAETWAMLVLGFVAIASYAGACGLMIASAVSGGSLREGVVIVGLTWALIVPGMLLLWRASRRRRHLAAAAEQFLCASHLSGVSVWWIAALYERSFASVESGVWMTAVACACDVALIALLQAKARGAADV